MNAILIVQIYDLPRQMLSMGTIPATDMVSQFRSLGKKLLGNRMIASFYDSIYALYPNVKQALDHATKMINESDIPLRCSIGYGQLYQTADNMVWGPAFNNAFSLILDAVKGEILLTNQAQAQVSPIDLRQRMCF